jgi:hypothetical protein
MLISIERIQNVRLFKQFCVSHEDFIARYNREDNGTMRFLYHGCPEAASKKIIERGFNRSYCGLNGKIYIYIFTTIIHLFYKDVYMDEECISQRMQVIQINLQLQMTDKKNECFTVVFL